MPCSLLEEPSAVGVTMCGRPPTLCRGAQRYKAVPRQGFVELVLLHRPRRDMAQRRERLHALALLRCAGLARAYARLVRCGGHTQHGALLRLVCFHLLEVKLRSPKVHFGLPAPQLGLTRRKLSPRLASPRLASPHARTRAAARPVFAQHIRGGCPSRLLVVLCKLQGPHGALQGLCARLVQLARVLPAVVAHGARRRSRERRPQGKDARWQWPSLTSKANRARCH